MAKGTNIYSCKLVIYVVYYFLIFQIPPTTYGSRSVYELVDWTVETPQWLKHDQYEVTNKSQILEAVRFPPMERFYGFTHITQELVELSEEQLQLVPNASKLLQFKKAPRRAFYRRIYQPLLSTGINARHKFAEGLHVRWRQIGVTDEPLMAFIYMPTGWPLFLGITFVCFIVFIPIMGAALVHAGFQIAWIYRQFLWGPVKMALRWILIKEKLSMKRWQQAIAPPHFLEPRISWKLPVLLRNENLEDIPCELAYKPPTNTIDYTMYILTEEDYDEMDLGMDELEFVDDLLQFRETNPKVVARLLKHRLGVEKFYYYFDEDVLSDESDEEDVAAAPAAEPTQEEIAEVGKEGTQYDYNTLMEVDEPWMHSDYDENFPGTAFQLEEIRKRRKILEQLKKEMRYLHSLINTDTIYDKSYETEEDRKKALKKANKVMDKFARFSNITKERIADIEPSSKAQTIHNTALSKYLPLIDQMSHYNHRLNLKHVKQKDPDRRKVQLDIFGGP